MWISDGFASGTNLVIDVRKGSGSSFPSFLTEFPINDIESYLIFSASDGYQSFKGSDTDGNYYQSSSIIYAVSFTLMFDSSVFFNFLKVTITDWKKYYNYYNHYYYYYNYYNIVFVTKSI